MVSRKLFAGAFAVFVAGILVTLPLRTTELLTAIEPKTGFYKSTGGVVAAVNTALIVFTVLLLVPVLLKSAGPTRIVLRKSRAAAVVAMIVAVCFCLAGAAQMRELLAGGTVGNLLISATEFLSAVFFFLLGARRLGAGVGLAVPGLLPVLWGTVILIVSFMKYTTIASISGYLFDVLKMVSVLAFVYYNALAAGGIPNRRVRGGLVAFGFTGALYCMLTTVPEYAAHAINSAYGSTPDFGGLLYLSLTVYMVYVSVEAVFSKGILSPESGPSRARDK